MIPRYFAIEARCIKINNGKYEFKIMYQQATSGLHYPPQTKQQISKYQQAMQRDSKDPNQTINLLPSYLRMSFSSKALFFYKHLKFPFKVNKTTETAAPLLLSYAPPLPRLPFTSSKDLPQISLSHSSKNISSALPKSLAAKKLSRIFFSRPWDPPSLCNQPKLYFLPLQKYL